MIRIILAALIAGMLVYTDTLAEKRLLSVKNSSTIRYCMNYSPSVMTEYGPVIALQGAWPCAWLPIEQDV